ncbi:UDP-glucose 4-epimerase GalE [Microlunatus sp. Gsoil 973]|uniref:UDP-glucose 4-epimerase GalE n=1 Tax=Microlunatus sp. Gsoil 973 TaxID=2672569 RepID=UPI0012B4F175|nr:UDP-glucose 4-epimerase GalE [Microlunatus sp. Gsoil 973]QGN31737.1 UDP-glucose 4-epimerase GalE [Microlunatus sp. Gsoil 973]
MSVLVTGGAGYIGSHVVRLLRQRGDTVVVVDDLSSGVAANVGDAPLVQLDLSVSDAVDSLRTVIADHGVDAVIHIAAKKQVGESAARPAWYYTQNVGGTAHLMLAMEAAGVRKLMFSSSAATYGNPDVPPGSLMRENGPSSPISPYGETKLVCEWMMRDAARAWGLRGVGLRYFNVAGAGWPELGDPTRFNLIPIALGQLTEGKQPVIFGSDYPTQDGTCIRDYIHVLDLADAHLAALDYLDRDDRPYDIFNVGTGTGSSVSEVLEQIGRSTGYDVRPTIGDRRPGDPATLVADVSRIADALGWRAHHDLAAMVDSAWQAWEPTHGAPAVRPS